ncbi:MAG TPA: thiamine pyrophosphate-dependent dehydrogenase E1 component subunit alpha [Bryobacteraceae bacterium]|jgi:TPP-dependent pyruvate/acetoin dehydrogenase alpha subunit
MCTIRHFEREIVQLNRAGLVAGTAHLYIGMEAIAVGACAAMRENDLLTSTHRGHGHCIARGLDMGHMMAEILGRADGYCHGKGGSMHITDVSRGVLGADGIVGGGIPLAVGAALGLRLKRNNSIVFCFFGEGAANQGSFHEALNLASLRQLPVVFICENNQWALSASFSETTAGQSVARRAVAYAMASDRVDGNDVEAVFRAANDAAERARRGSGPTLLECITYRHEGHSVFTRQEIRPTDEIEHWKKQDPIERYRSLLIAEDIASASKLGEIDAEVSRLVSSAAAFAKNSPSPGLATAFSGVYA